MHPAFSPLVIKNVAIKAINPIRRITVPPTLVEKESQLNLTRIRGFRGTWGKSPGRYEAE
jgi:hypothetical protein